MSEIEQIAQIILKMIIERKNKGLPELSAFHIADELFFRNPKDPIDREKIYKACDYLISKEYVVERLIDKALVLKKISAQ
nr:hypothetical protein [uncultured Neisseria sp.]